MKLAAISDLHHPESKVDLLAIVTAAQAGGAQALVLIGDAVSQFHPPLLTEVFSVLRAAAPVCIYVPGNHELWSRDASTAALYERALPKLCEDHGWHYLDSGPIVVDGVAVVGNIGWYDYSMTDRERFAEFPVALGGEILKAMRSKPCKTVPLGSITDEQLAEKHLVIVPPPDVAAQGFPPALLRWNDSRWVRLGVADGVFAADCARRLREHLVVADNRAERIVVATHMAPFGRALGAPTNPVEALCRAYQGAEVLGDSFLGNKKVVLSLFGHRHRPGVHQVEHLPVINVTGRPDRGGSLVMRDV